MLNEKGQAVLLDVFFAVLIFMIVFFSLNQSWDRELQKTNDYFETQELQLKANNILDSLLKGEGSPSNWNELDFNSDVSKIGLAKKSLSLSPQKVNAFKNLDSNYSQVKLLFGVPEYDYFFQLDAENDVNAGIDPGNSFEKKILLRRVVEFDGSEAIVNFALYKIG